jgi:hypothetical protein
MEGQMNAKNRKTIFIIGACMFLVLSLVLLITSVSYAGKNSPFVGQWFAVDVDESDIRLSIAGPSRGSFEIIWTESYISYCGGEAGIIRGQGQLLEKNVMRAHLRLVCFTTRETLDFEVTWVYDQGTDTINSDFITWHRANSSSNLCSSPTAGLSGWWPGDGNASDLIFGRDGTFQGDATTGSGLVDLAFKLDGDGDFIEVPDDQGLNFGPGDFTTDLWVNFETTEGEQVLVEKFIQDVNGWTLTKLQSNVLRLAMYNMSGGEFSLDSDPLDIHPNVWYHFAATRQGSTINLYMNGVNVASNPEVGLMNLNSPASIKIGRRGDEKGFFLNGRVDEVEIFNGTALSEEQLMAIYKAGSAGKCKENLITPPYFGLRVNYGHDWVESFYEAGHSVKIMVTEGDGISIKATATLVTEPQDFWGGESGFQTSPEDWIPGPLDIQPYDWVFGWVDNGASAQVQLGEINGVIDLEADSIEGTVYAPWFLPGPEVEIDCHSWGAPEDIVINDWVYPNNEDTYSCSWAGDWDIEYYQPIGVGYSGPDGNWVANAFVVVNPHFTIFPEWEWFDGIDWPDGEVSISVAEKSVCNTQGESTAGFFNGGFPEGCDIEVGDQVTFFYGYGEIVRTHTVQELAVTIADAMDNTVTGTADYESIVSVWPHATGQALLATASIDGIWRVDFTGIYDLVPNECGRAQIFDGEDNGTAVDWCVPNPHLYAFPEDNAVEAWEWTEGKPITLTINSDPNFEWTGIPEVTSWGDPRTYVRFELGQDYNLQVGDEVTLTDGRTVMTHTVRYLAVTQVFAEENTVVGMADPETMIQVWPHGYDQDATVEVMAGEDGVWQADFTGLIDLEIGMGGRSQIVVDEFGNATVVDWSTLAAPYIQAQLNEYWFIAWWFSRNTTLTYWIYDTDGTTLLLGPEIVQSNAWGAVGIPVGESVDLSPGQLIIVTDGLTTKELLLEALTFDVFDPDAGYFQGTAPEPFGRYVWLGIGWENDGWSTEINTDEYGGWMAYYGSSVPGDYQWVAAQVFDGDGDISEVRPSPRSVMAGNFSIAWSQTNPEEVIYLSWNGSGNLTNTWQHEYCSGDLEFFGNSWVSENEGGEYPFFASLVGWGTTGDWSQFDLEFNIDSISSGCPGSADIPINTTYQFFDGDLANLIEVQRTFVFGLDYYLHDLRPFIPRLYPLYGYTEVIHPNFDGTELITDGTCGYGCILYNWDGSWFAIHNPYTDMGMIVQRDSSDYSVAIWADDDGGSETNASSFLLLHPEGGFTGTITETEYLYFYDSSLWIPDLILPPGCQP